MSDQNELKSMGLKATFPRLKILDVFRKSDQRHHSAEDVYRALLAEDVDIGLATVYRVLTQFEQAGILSRSQFDGGKADPEIEKRQHIIAKEKKFTLESHTMMLYGICKECNSK